MYESTKLKNIFKTWSVILCHTELSLLLGKVESECKMGPGNLDRWSQNRFAVTAQVLALYNAGGEELFHGIVPGDGK